MERLTHERVNGIKKDEVRAMLRETYTARRILALEPDVRTACTACALKGLGK